jgi:hypothetical protein
VEPTFFVCYRREDAGYAAALTHALAQRHGRDRVFKDITSLPMGRNWHSEVVAAIGRSTHVLALIGPRWMAGVDPHGGRNGQLDPIVFELTEALRAGRVIVPVLLGGQRMPPADHLPYALRCLSDLNAAHIRTESADTDVTMLVARLSEPVLRSERPTPHVAGGAARPPRRSGAGRIVGRLVALAVVGALALVGVTLWDKLPGLDTASAGGDQPAPSVTQDEPGPSVTPHEPVPSVERNEPTAAEQFLTLSPTRGTTKTRVTATATGFTPGKQVRFWFHLEFLGEETVSADGSASTTFTPPERFGRYTGGTWQLSVEQLNSPYTASAPFILDT